MTTEFILSQADSRPMYLQIMDEISRRVALGDWRPGFKLPSIRELAVSVRVSVITVKRAYLELERAGVIITQQGRGSWISDKLEIADMRKEELARHLKQAAQLAGTMGIAREELVAVLEEYITDGGS